MGIQSSKGMKKELLLLGEEIILLRLYSVDGAIFNHHIQWYRAFERTRSEL